LAGLTHIANGLVTGSVLILFGLVPGLFQEFAEGVHSYVALLSSRPSSLPHSYDRFRQPVWLAAIGVALIAAALLT
jgi:hypothetical protein